MAEEDFAGEKEWAVKLTCESANTPKVNPSRFWTASAECPAYSKASVPSLPTTSWKASAPPAESSWKFITSCTDSVLVKNFRFAYYKNAAGWDLPLPSMKPQRLCLLWCVATSVGVYNGKLPSLCAAMVAYDATDWISLFGVLRTTEPSKGCCSLFILLCMQLAGNLVTLPKV